MRKIKLKYLIIIVVAFSFILSTASSLWSSYQLNMDLLQENSLEKNRVYAKKLAQTVTLYLTETFHSLEYSANVVSDKMDDEEKLSYETNRLSLQDTSFNSAFIVNKEGKVLTVAPSSIHAKGMSLDGLTALKSHQPHVSTPFLAPTGREVIIISQPIFSKNGDYLGLIGVSIYIHESNILDSILGRHFYKDGSYVYVVDQTGRVIYHQDKKRIGDDGYANPVVQRVINGDSGTQYVVNTKGVEMLAGYSPVPLARWGVVAQTPLDVAIKPAGQLVMKMLLLELPALILSIFIVLFAAGKIAKPLQNLAKITEESTHQSELNQLNQLKAWYYEAAQLKNALISSLSFMHNQVNYFKDQSTIDPLTGVANRRSLDKFLQQWTEQREEFTLMMLDIDHFKNINDTYGHAVGDEVLKYFAKEINNIIRHQDLSFRYGGEEFIILLPNISTQDAFKIAERICKKLETTSSPSGDPITISVGICSFPIVAESLEELLAKADQALYDAKNTGRNRVIIAEK